mgnify:CR=1 FL=1
MSAISFIGKILGFTKKFNLLAKILEAEKKLKSGTGPEKLAYVLNALKKALGPAVKHLLAEAKKKGVAESIEYNDLINSKLILLEDLVNAAVKVLNALDLLLPHTK